MALTERGGQSGGPRYGWGGVPNDPGTGARAGSGGSRTSFNSGLDSGRYTAGPEAGLRRGSWQWQGHGPSAQRDYGWDYQGGVGRDEITQHTEARGGGSYLSHMAQDRSGGLPRYHDDYDAGERSLRGAGGYARGFDRGGMGGYSGGGTGGEYDQGYRASGGTFGGSGNRHGGGDAGFRGGLAPAFGGEYGVGNHFADRHDQGFRAADGVGFGSGNRTGGQYDAGFRAMGGHTLGSGASARRYGADYGGGYGARSNRGGYQEVTYGFGPRQSVGYGRDFGQGRALGGRGGYGADYGARPLTDDEFYARVNRW